MLNVCHYVGGHALSVVVAFNNEWESFADLKLKLKREWIINHNDE